MDLSNVTAEVAGQPAGLVQGLLRSPLQWPSLLLLCLCVILGGRYLRQPNMPLPPGPRAVPLVGNMHQLLSGPLPEVLLQWHQKYGPLVSFRSGGRVVVSVSSHEMCRDLMSRKGSLYNSRPQMVVAGQHATKGVNIALMPYGKQWEAHRRIIASVTTANASRRYRLVEDLESQQVMVDFLTSNDFRSNFLRYGAGIVTTLSYGQRLPDRKDGEFLTGVQLRDRLLAAVAKFHYAVVELFPVLDYLPGFLAPWRAHGTQYYNEATAFHSQNLTKAKTTASWNWVKQTLPRPEAQAMSTDELSTLFGTALQAGIETTPAILRVFIKAMLCHPQAMQKAQAELDTVVGADRLPSFDDKPSLPYINAIVGECCRWQAVMAVGVPHCTLRDDEYGGYRVPKGAIVFANAWAIGFNEDIYDRPREFIPERWIDNPSLPSGGAFGYGRRVCPGKAIGLDSLFINVSRVLWGYDLAHGERKVGLWDIQHSFSATPRDFDVDFSIRTERHRQTLLRTWSTAEKDPDVLLRSIDLN